MLNLTGPLGHDFSPIVDELKKSRGETIVFSPNPGNAGDSVINFACYRLFDKLGLPYEVFRDSRNYKGRYVVFAGGGNLTSPASPVAARIKKIHQECGSLVVLPHTVTHFPELWSQLDSRATIFAREEASFNFLKQCAGEAKILCAHDMAFSVEPREFTHSKAVKTLLGCVRRGDERWKAIVRAVVYLAAAKGRLNAIRTDSEKTSLRIPKYNVDVSRQIWTVGQDPNEVEKVARLMFLFLSLPRRITTNRLHVGICSALLGKQVDFYDNSYGKNKNVYQSSMRDIPYFNFLESDDLADRRDPVAPN